MKTKFLFFSAIIFLLLGWNSKDGVLFFFFAVHLFTLSIGAILLKFEKKLQPRTRIATLPPSEPSES
ncbi:MAG: hypothetical protein PVG06_14940 [Desulfobacterales bacterium]